MASFILTPDQILRAVAALEVAWAGDDDALAALAQDVPGEQPLAVLVAEYGTLMLENTLLTITGIRGLPEAEQQEAIEVFNGTLNGHQAELAAGFLQGWARSTGSGAHAVGDLARAVLRALLSFTTDGDDETEVHALLDFLRADALAHS
ncbi:hypothetical protein ACFVVA_38095 [Kitasatospora sp. NPDC058048]|uniref:hypothetical protein n=1 Tax=Kitasatospora sp. NPDC058048 TaxID=3346313 RepID=UPI0036DF1F44